MVDDWNSDMNIIICGAGKTGALKTARALRLGRPRKKRAGKLVGCAAIDLDIAMLKKKIEILHHQVGCEVSGPGGFFD